MGAIAGGAAGVAAGLGMIAIPGIGPVVAAGWLAALAAGAVGGGVAGGLIGALVESGTSKESAELYAEAVRRGGAIVTAKVADDDAARYSVIMDKRAFDVTARENMWRRSGWNGYDPAAPAYDAEQEVPPRAGDLSGFEPSIKQDEKARRCEPAGFLLRPISDVASSALGSPPASAQISPYCTDWNDFAVAPLFTPEGLLWRDTCRKHQSCSADVEGLGSAGMASMTTASVAEGTTVNDSPRKAPNGDRSKTIVKHEDGSKTVIKQHGDRMKKIHTAANGDKTIVKKTTY